MQQYVVFQHRTLNLCAEMTPIRALFCNDIILGNLSGLLSVFLVLGRGNPFTTVPGMYPAGVRSPKTAIVPGEPLCR